MWLFWFTPRQKGLKRLRKRYLIIGLVLATALTILIPSLRYSAAETKARKDKLQPTAKKDYWQALVELRSSFSAPATFHEMTGIALPFSDPTMWVIIRADLQGTVTRVSVQ